LREFVLCGAKRARTRRTCGYRKEEKNKLTVHGNKRDAETFEARKRIELGVTDRMREHYSTVTADEQRSSIGNVVQLFARPHGGEGPGEGPRQVGRK
jgi:hypothetical protein